MRHHILLLTAFASLSASGCNPLVCADGTIERDGKCEPADTTTNGAMCGPFTVLQGDRCVPQFLPTECDPSTTQANYDPETGVYTCVGTGGGGCGAPLACASPAGATKQTICGQIYDFEANAKYAAPGATGAKCATPTASGPCALDIHAYDAIAFGTNPQTAAPLAVGNVYIDDCGRYRLTDIEIGGIGPFVGLGFDDAGMPMGPTGTTVTVGVATQKLAMMATKDLEGFIVTPATTAKWAGAGGPPIAGGMYAPIYRKHKVGNPGDPLEPQPGVYVLKGTNMVMSNDFYFQAAETTRGMLDVAANVTGANGTALVTGAALTDNNVWNGSGGLGANCQWEPHSAASLPYIVFVQVFHKINQLGTCND